MPSQVMDHSSMSPSSYFLEEICYPAQTQDGLWNPETMLDHQGSKYVPSPPVEKLSRRAQAMEFLQFPKPCHMIDQVAKLSLEQEVLEAEERTNLSITSCMPVDYSLGTGSHLFAQPASYFTRSNKFNMEGPYQNGIFSSSLSEILSRKLKFSTNNVLFGQCVEGVTSHCEEEELFESLEEIEAQTIGNLLPDEEDLLSGAEYHLEYAAQPNIGDSLEDYDVFSSGGGMELGEDGGLCSSKSLRNSDLYGTNSNGLQEGLSSSFVGQHPSRTLFVRNINSNIDDSELKGLFEQYGDIRTLYTACKHRGFVMISYYDIRAACDAISALQNKSLRRRNLDIHFLIPKGNPSEKDLNQGTLTVVHLDFSVSNDDLRQTLGAYGEIKEIRDNPYKCHHKFIEFYDVRAAEAALHDLNRSDIAGKQIKVEPNHPGSTRRSLTQLPPELEQAESIPYLQRGSPLDSTPGSFRSVSHGLNTSTCLENESIQSLHSSIGAGIPISQFMENGFHHNLPQSVPQGSPSSMGIAPAGNQSGLGEPSLTLEKMGFNFQRRPPFHPHSLPDFHDGLYCGVPYISPGTIAENISLRPMEAITNGPVHRVGTTRHAVDPIDGVFGSDNGSFPLHGQQYTWRNSDSYHSHPSNPLMWPNSPSFGNGVHGHPSPQLLHDLPRRPSHMLNAVLPIQHHHVGSAPTVYPSLWDRQHVCDGESHEVSDFHPGSIGSNGISGHSKLHHVEQNCNIFPHFGRTCMDLSIASTNVGLHSPQQRFHMLPRRNSMIHIPNSFDDANEWVISRRGEVISSQAGNKKQYDLDIDLILRGEDTRTTLMIKNIPNKYTSKMLLAAIDENHRGTYDFIYLPIDFKNKCNVGYAFINMISPSQIVPFYQAFNGKKWEKFNSEKVASLAYARIQGKGALISHFQNSSLMNEDKRCRPILFHTDGPNAGDQEPFPMGVNIRSRPGKPRNTSSEGNHQGIPSAGEQASNITDSSSGSARDSE